MAIAYIERELDNVWEYGNNKYLHRKGSGADAAAMGEWFESLARWQWFVTTTFDPAKADKGFSQAGVGTARRMLRDMLATVPTFTKSSFE